MAVQSTGRPHVDDQLEGAESTLGRRAAPRQIERQHLSLVASHRSCGAVEEFARASSAGPGDPDLLQHILQIRIRQMHIVFGHPIADLA